MERLLKPAIFETDHNAQDAAKQFKHFFRTFQNFSNAVEDDSIRLKLLINHISADVFQLLKSASPMDKLSPPWKVRTSNHQTLYMHVTYLWLVGRKIVRASILSCKL